MLLELWDEGLLGLAALDVIHHCREELMKKKFRMVPKGATVYAQLIELRTTIVSGFDMSLMNGYR